MAESNRPTQNSAAPSQEFRRHKYLSYQGYAFPWYATLLWISFFVGGLIYLVRHILLQ
jgi:hypothetical protein